MSYFLCQILLLCAPSVDAWWLFLLLRNINFGRLWERRNSAGFTSLVVLGRIISYGGYWTERKEGVRESRINHKINQLDIYY
jgi:hypothetical protein